MTMKQYYTIKSGNTLWAIAERFYQSGLLWPRLHQANCRLIANPDLIFPGQVILIP